MNPKRLVWLTAAIFSALLAAAACASDPTAPASEDENPYDGAATGNFCWSRYPLLQDEKTCATEEESAVAMDACTRTALDVLSHSHAANRDWFGICMKRYGLSRLDK